MAFQVIGGNLIIKEKRVSFAAATKVYVSQLVKTLAGYILQIYKRQHPIPCSLGYRLQYEAADAGLFADTKADSVIP